MPRARKVVVSPAASAKVTVPALPVVLPEEPETLPVTLPVRLPVTSPVKPPVAVAVPRTMVPPAKVRAFAECVAVTSPLLKSITAPEPRKRSDHPIKAEPRASVLSVSEISEVLIATEARLSSAVVAPPPPPATSAAQAHTSNVSFHFKIWVSAQP